MKIITAISLSLFSLIGAMDHGNSFLSTRVKISIDSDLKKRFLDHDLTQDYDRLEFGTVASETFTVHKFMTTVQEKIDQFSLKNSGSQQCCVYTKRLPLYVKLILGPDNSTILDNLIRTGLVEEIKDPA